MNVDECKKSIISIGWRCGVPPSFISERLLSKDDKEDMLNNLLPPEVLHVFVETWKEQGMSDVAHGKSKPYNKYWRE
jgi:hypothetical protein